MNLDEFRRRVGPSVIAHKRFNKLFCIGWNKTGTTTLEAVLRAYGYQMPNQQVQELRLTLPVFRCDYTELRRFVDRYDAFQDLPFSQGEAYAAVDALFPDSRFILSERDPDVWFESMLRFHKQVFRLDTLHGLTEQDVLTRFKYLFPGYMHARMKRLLTRFEGDRPVVHWDLLHDKDFFVAEYLARNQRIKCHFQDCPERLLVIDVTQEPTTHRLCEFLQIPTELAFAMPRLNAS